MIEKIMRWLFPFNAQHHPIVQRVSDMLDAGASDATIVETAKLEFFKAYAADDKFSARVWAYIAGKFSE